MVDCQDTLRLRGLHRYQRLLRKSLGIGVQRPMCQLSPVLENLHIVRLLLYPLDQSFQTHLLLHHLDHIVLQHVRFDFD